MSKICNRKKVRYRCHTQSRQRKSRFQLCSWHHHRHCPEEQKEPQRLTGVGLGEGGLLQKQRNPSQFAFRFQNTHKETTDVRKGSPWIVKSTLISSTKPESQSPPATTKWHLRSVFDMPSGTVPGVGQPNLLPTKGTAVPGTKSDTAASKTQGLERQFSTTEAAEPLGPSPEGPISRSRHLPHPQVTSSKVPLWQNGAARTAAHVRYRIKLVSKHPRQIQLRPGKRPGKGPANCNASTQQ
ncbi:uncharacterized protein LOC125133648 isoform X2 [Phacochoerus africanus]|uniref:uncharacterized protein LOC125133648 isoform X2 n=1 Tax=Phacochoerus africanus TaxID=41426 RepID=UPI001FD92CBF|nr:uncharacterized protein LOC125133648 isoform X2 [Phacochoerus africanus]